jgi:hypothetical protein
MLRVRRHRTDTLGIWNLKLTGTPILTLKRQSLSAKLSNSPQTRLALITRAVCAGPASGTFGAEYPIQGIDQKERLSEPPEGILARFY